MGRVFGDFVVLVGGFVVLDFTPQKFAFVFFSAVM